MRRRIHRAALVLCLLVPAAACDSATEPEPTVTVEITARAAAAQITVDTHPRVTCSVELEAKATGAEGESAVWEDGIFRWYAGPIRATPFDSSMAPAAEVRESWGADSIAVGATSTSIWDFWADVPFTLTGRYRYRVGGTGEVKAADFDFFCGLDLPPGGAPAPEISNFSISPVSGELEPGDTVKVVYSASSTLGLWRTAVRVAGAFEAGEEFIERLEKSLTRTVNLVVPPGAALGAPVKVSIMAADAALRPTTAGSLSTPPLVDRTPPEVLWATTKYNLQAGLIEDLTGQYAVGDTIRLFTKPHDNHALTWLVYTLDAPANVRDSVRAAVGGFVYHLIPVRKEWVGSSILTLFARDAAGHLSAPFSSRPGGLRFYDRTSRPLRSASQNGHYQDAVIDPVRNVLYLSWETRPEISVLSLETMTFGSPIPLPVPADGIDVTAGGDSLLAALPDRRALAVVDLTRPAEPAIVPIALADPALDHRPRRLRITANGKAIVVLSSSHSDGGRVLEYDLAAGAESIRWDMDRSSYGWEVLITRSSDRSKVLLHKHSNPCAREYVAATGQFGLCGWLDGVGPLSVDATGTRILRGYFLYDGELNPLLTLDDRYGASATGGVSPDGAWVYISTVDGIDRGRAATGEFVERIPHPPVSGAILFARDGELMVTISRYADTAPYRTDITTVNLR